MKKWLGILFVLFIFITGCSTKESARVMNEDEYTTEVTNIIADMLISVKQLSDQIRQPDYDDATWRNETFGLLSQLREKAKNGQKMQPPKEYETTQNLFAKAMKEYEDAFQLMDEELRNRDVEKMMQAINNAKRASAQLEIAARQMTEDAKK